MDDSLKNIAEPQYSINNLANKMIPDLKKYKMMNLKRTKSNRLINFAKVHKSNDNLKSLASNTQLHVIGVIERYNQLTLTLKRFYIFNY